MTTAKYVALSTYRRDGTAVSTPVWFVTDGDRLLVWTDATSGKVRRIRSNPRVGVAACDVRGRPRSTAVMGEARVLDDSIGPEVHRLLRRKHRIVKPIIDAWNRVSRGVRRRPAPLPAYLEIRLDES
jgi:PPOX class probable F420-dependent enzyme